MQKPEELKIAANSEEKPKSIAEGKQLKSKEYFDHEQFRALHNQKTGDFNPETGVLYDQQSEKFKDVVTFKEKERVEKEVGPVGKLEEKVKKVLNKLDSAKLLPEAQNDLNQQKLLQEKVKIAKGLLQEVLASVGEYVDSIKEMGETKADIGSDDFKERLAVSDGYRRMKHNKLIDSINITNRFISNTFGNISEPQLDNYLRKEKSDNRPVVMVERMNLPKNIFLPDYIDTNRREQVMDWAIAIESELSKIKKDIK